MITNYAPNKQIYSLETGNGHCRWPSGCPVRMATKKTTVLMATCPCVANLPVTSSFFYSGLKPTFITNPSYHRLRPSELTPWTITQTIS